MPMAGKEHQEVIERRRRWIDVDILDSEDEYEDSSIYHDGADSDEEEGSGLVREGVT